MVLYRPVGSNYRLGGGGTHKKQLQIGGGHTYFFKNDRPFFFIFFIFFGGGHICANYLGGTAPRAPPPIPTGLLYKRQSSANSLTFDVQSLADHLYDTRIKAVQSLFPEALQILRRQI